jgi:pantoate--beta-alanine ligase
MNVTASISEVRQSIKEWKKAGLTVGFVPTMGALHKGHLYLIQIALQKADKVVVSIFVNPKQFGPNEDFDNYPRKLQTDLDLCEEHGADLVFTPERSDMYPGENYLSIEVRDLNKYMCGGSRPGFFQGILLVVNKLFNIVTPDFAVFGQKDIQQFYIIRKMVKEFNLDVELVMGDIIRADDGLALSSRNAYLSDEQRILAPGLYRSLTYIKQQIQDGVREPALLLKHQRLELEEKGFKIDYLDLFSTDTLAPVGHVNQGETVIIAGAAYLGKTRLIDNLIMELN